MVDALTVFFAGMTIALAGSAALLLYPVYAYASNVLYSRGVTVLAASLLALTVGWLLGYAQAYSLVQWQSLDLLTQSLFTLSSALFLWANWEFARDFVVLDDRELPDMGAYDDRAASGGFEQVIEEGSAEGER